MRDHNSSATGLTIGVDLGDRVSHLVVLDRGGEVGERGTVESRMDSFLDRFAAWPPSRVVMEVGTHSPWASHALSSQGHEVIVANARQVHLIHQSRNKHDRADAELLARLGRADPKLLRPIRHRPPSARADLALIGARDLLVRQRTALSTHVKCVVKSAGGRIPSTIGPAALAQKARPFISRELREALQPILEQLAFLVSRIRKLERKIEKLGRERYPETQILRQVDGLGPITALAFVLTVEDPGRFDRCREVGPYLGLVPRRDASGRQDPELPITKAGDKRLRWLLGQCAQRILGPRGKDSDLRRWGLALAARGQKNAKKRAVVAVARKLSVLLLALLKSGQEYEPLRNHGGRKAA